MAFRMKDNNHCALRTRLCFVKCALKNGGRKNDKGNKGYKGSY